MAGLDSGGANYFEGMKMSKKQKAFMILLVAGTFIEQMDLYNFGMLAPALMKVWNLTIEQVGNMQGAFAIGAIFGALIFGWLADKKGRKPAMATALLIGGAGAVAAAMAPNYTFLIAARALCGFGITGGLVIEPNFLVEMVPSDKRSRYQGILGIVALMGVPLSTFIAKALLTANPENWRYAAAIPSLGIILGLLFIWLVYESPRWLVTNNRAEEGKRVFKELTGKELNIDPDFQCIVDKVTYSEAFKVMFSKAYAKRTILFFWIFLLLYNAGFMFMQWLPTLLTKEGMDLAMAMKYQQWVTLAMLIGPFYVIFFGDKGGRKFPYAIALTIIAVGLLVASVAGSGNTGLLTIGVVIVGALYITNQGFSSILYGGVLPDKGKSHYLFHIFIFPARSKYLYQ